MPSKTSSILLGGVAFGVFAVLMSLLSSGGAPGGAMGMVAGCLSCLGYLAAGLLAVWHYTNTNQLTIPVGQGVGIGAMAGVVAAIVGLLLTLVLRAAGILPSVEEILAQMEQSGAFDEMGEAQMEQTRGMMEMFDGPLAWGIGIVMGAILGLIGGAIGASIFKKGGEAPVA